MFARQQREGLSPGPKRERQGLRGPRECSRQRRSLRCRDNDDDHSDNQYHHDNQHLDDNEHHDHNSEQHNAYDDYHTRDEHDTHKHGHNSGYNDDHSYDRYPACDDWGGSGHLESARHEAGASEGARKSGQGRTRRASFLRGRQSRRAAVHRLSGLGLRARRIADAGNRARIAQGRHGLVRAKTIRGRQLIGDRESSRACCRPTESVDRSRDVPARYRPGLSLEDVIDASIPLTDGAGLPSPPSR